MVARPLEWPCWAHAILLDAGVPRHTLLTEPGQHSKDWHSAPKTPTSQGCCRAIQFEAHPGDAHTLWLVLRIGQADRLPDSLQLQSHVPVAAISGLGDLPCSLLAAKRR